MKPAPLRRKTALKRANGIRKRRQTKHQLANLMHRGYVAWVASQPCCSCGTRTNVQVAHVGQGGTGMKHGSDAETIPMCGPHWLDNVMIEGCHVSHDQRKGRFSPDQYEARHLIEWRAHQVAVHRGKYEALGIIKATEPVVF